MSRRAYDDEDDVDPVDDAPDPDETEADEEEALDAIEAAEAESQDRVWLRTIAAVVIKLQSTEHEFPPRVQMAVDELMIAACDRARRILHADLPDDEL